MNTTPQDTMLEAAGLAPEDLYCGDPACGGYYDAEQLSDCACGNQVCQDCLGKVCEACEAHGCAVCLVEDDDGRLLCANCKESV